MFRFQNIIKIALSIIIAFLIYSVSSTTTYAQCCGDGDCGGGGQCIGAPAVCPSEGSGYCVSGYETCSGSANSSSCPSGECCGGNGLCTTCGSGGKGGGVEFDCHPRKDCPLNSSCTPSGIYSCNILNANYSSYVDYFVGDHQGGYAGTCPMGNAEEMVQICSDGSCYWYDRKYNCCPAGTVSQYYYTQEADYTVSVNPCTGENLNGSIYNCYPGSFVSYVENGYQCGLTPKDENGERFPIYTGTRTCRPAPTKNHVCTPTCTISAPSTPLLTSPANGSSVSSSTVSLSWNNSAQNWGVSCATNNQYEVYVGSCSGSLALAGIVGSSTSSIQFSGSEGQTYCWKVRAKNGSANTDSAVWSFTINNAEPWWQVKDGDVTTNGEDAVLKWTASF